MLNRFDRLASQGCQTLFFALSPHAEGLAFQIHVFQVQADQLADPQPGRIDRLEDRPVASAKDGRRFGRFQEGFDLLDPATG